MYTFSMTARWRFPIATLVLMTGLGVAAFGFTAPAALAAPARTLAPQSAPVSEFDKEVLGETSIDGPAISSLSDYVPNPQTYPPGSFPATAIAWSGTDGYHSLNVILSGNGLDYSKSKITLHEYSATHPAVLLYQNNHSGTLGPNLVVLAWTGTDANHSLNVMFDVYGVRQMITLSDRSLYSPALAYFNGQVWLAWTGTDPNHSLNVMAMGPDGVNPGQKTILSDAGFSARGAPSLREDMRDKLLLLTWTQATSPYFIDLAQSANGTTWAPSFTPPPPQTSFHGPDVVAVPGSIASGLPTDFWSWTGTDGSHSLNIAYTSTLASWPAPIVTLNEQAFGGPALAYSTKLGGTPHGAVTVLLAWTGVDGLHHLNIAAFAVS
jgi:hypothetical protein